MNRLNFMMERARNILSVWLSSFVASRHVGIFVFLWSFILSVLVSSFVSVSPLVSLLLLIIALGIFAAEKIYTREVSKIIFLLCLAIFAFGLGTLRYSIKDFHEVIQPIPTGIVASEPEHRDADTRFVFESDNGEKALVSTDLLNPVQYGDRVQVLGKFERPGVITDENGRSFDYGAYLSKDDIYFTASFAKVTVEIELPALGQASGQSRSIRFRLVGVLLKVKNSFVEQIKKILSEPEASLLAGLIVAGKQVLPGNILDDFKHAGVVHIVVLSGYNVTIIAEFFLGLFGFLGKRRSAIISALGIILFTLMTGATATVVRAAIMVLALLLGKIIARPYSPGRVLLFTAFLMIIWNPKVLVFDPSFQLSFLAMLALVYVSPIVQKLLAERLLPALGQASGKSRPIVFPLLELVSITIATQIVALPFLLYSIGQVSVVSLFSNILILFFVPYTMLIGFAAVLCTYISTYLAWPFAFISHLLLWWILGVAHFFGNLSFASIQISHFPLWLTVVLYLALGGLIVRLPAQPGNSSPHSAN